MNPPVSLEFTLALTARLAGLAITLQSLELFRLRESYSDTGIWSWRVLAPEFARWPKFSQRLLALAFDGSRFTGVVALQLMAGVGMIALPHAAFFATALVSTYLIAVRWRGSFNGGSDSMTLLVLATLFVASIATDPIVARVAVVYLGLQVCLSYAVSGWTKLRNNDWQNGRELSQILKLPAYEAPAPLRRLADNSAAMRMGAFGILAFQLGFSLALFVPHACAVAITLGAAFHVLNYYAFGLNRFLFAWAAAYPALYYSSFFFLN